MTYVRLEHVEQAARLLYDWRPDPAGCADNEAFEAVCMDKAREILAVVESVKEPEERAEIDVDEYIDAASAPEFHERVKSADKLVEDLGLVAGRATPATEPCPSEGPCDCEADPGVPFGNGLGSGQGLIPDGNKASPATEMCRSEQPGPCNCEAEPEASTPPALREQIAQALNARMRPSTPQWERASPEQQEWSGVLADAVLEVVQPLIDFWIEHDRETTEWGNRLAGELHDARAECQRLTRDRDFEAAEGTKARQSARDWHAECQRLREALTAKEEEYENRLAAFLQMSEERDKAEAQVTRLQGELERVGDRACQFVDQRDQAREELANERRITEALEKGEMIEHAADCFWRRATPSVDGDEAACCSCDALPQRLALWSALAAAREAARNK